MFSTGSSIKQKGGAMPQVAHASECSVSGLGVLANTSPELDSIKYSCRIFKVKKSWGKEYLAIVWDTDGDRLSDGELPKGELVFDEVSYDRDMLVAGEQAFIRQQSLLTSSWNMRHTL